MIPLTTFVICNNANNNKKTYHRRRHHRHVVIVVTSTVMILVVGLNFLLFQLPLSFHVVVSTRDLILLDLSNNNNNNNENPSFQSLPKSQSQSQLPQHSQLSQSRRGALPLLQDNVDENIIMMEGVMDWNTIPDVLALSMGHVNGWFRSGGDGFVVVPNHMNNDNNNNNTNDDHDDDDDDNDLDWESIEIQQRIQHWLPRLFYLALHYRFHQPALPEYSLHHQRKNKKFGSIIHNTNSYYHHHHDGSNSTTTTTNVTTNSTTNSGNNPSSDIDIDTDTDTDTTTIVVPPPSPIQYNCPDAKYIVMTIGSSGLGSLFNTNGMTLLLAAFRTGRIPIFWNVPKEDQKSNNHTKTNSNTNYNDWMLAPSTGCHEKTPSCYFLPYSPCTVTQEEIRNNATRFDIHKPNRRWFRRNLKLPTQYENDRIVVVSSGMMPTPFDKGGGDDDIIDMNRDIINTTVQVANELLSYWKMSVSSSSSSSSVALPKDDDHDTTTATTTEMMMRRKTQQQTVVNNEFRIIERAIEHMSNQTTIENIGYIGLWAYLLRLNPTYKQIVTEQTLQVLSSSGIINQEDKEDTELLLTKLEGSIGFPIRGSDKCQLESTCLSMETYVELAQDLYVNMSSSSSLSALSQMERPNLFLTTEDPKIFDQAIQLRRQDQHSSQHAKTNVTTPSTISFPYNMVLNTNDNLQGSGNPKFFRHHHKGEDTVISSLVALNLQLHASKVFGNCCSNWHSIIKKLIHAGLSTHKDAEFTCLNLAPAVFNKRKYRTCCQWGKDSECRQIYKEYRNSTKRV